jgi:hypothetical protein
MAIKNDNSQPDYLPTVYNPNISTQTQQTIADLNNNNFAGAWNTALGTSSLYGPSGYTQGSNDPLLLEMEGQSGGLQALDPTKTWTPAETQQYYTALQNNPVFQGQTVKGSNGIAESLGMNPYGQWGSSAGIPGDITANIAQAGNTPNVSQFAGSRPSISTLDRYGPIIPALVAGVAGSIIGPAAGGLMSSFLGSTAGTVAGGAVGGAASGALSAGVQGGNVGKGALTGAVGGGIGGGLQASGVTGSATNTLTNAGVPTSLAGGIAKGAIGAGTGALGSTLLGGNVGSSALTGGVGGFLNGAVGGVTGNNTLGNVASGLGGAAVGSLIGGGSTTTASGGLNYLGASAPGNNGNMAGTSTDSTLASTITGALPGVIQAGAGVYGSQNAAQAQTSADANAIGTQQQTLGNINNIWGTQQNLGQGAQQQLGAALGTNGQPANYSNFYNMPGYQFAVNQGTQAIQRQAASMGSAYTPNTAAAVGQYVTGTASQDYNTYIQQLMGAAGLGSTANQGLQTGNQTVGNNISQLQQNQGQAQASGVMGSANAIGGAFGASGVGTGLIGAAGKYLGGGNGGSYGNYTGSTAGTAGQVDTSGMGTDVGGLNNFQANPVIAPTTDTNFGGSLDYGSGTSTNFFGGSYGGSYG